MNGRNNIIKHWAEQSGVEIKGEYKTGLYVHYNGYDISLGYSDYFRRYTINLLVDQNTVPRSSVKKMHKSVKKIGMVQYDKTRSSIRFLFKKTNPKKVAELLDTGIEQFTNALAEQGIMGKEKCRYCNLPNTDSAIDIADGIIFPVHEKCKQDYIGKLLSEIEENKYNGNYLLGTIGAILGAIVGALPVMIALVGFNMFVWFLYTFIPIGAAYGYKLFRGIKNSYMGIVSILMALIVGFFSYATSMYLDMYVYDYQGYKVAQKIANNQYVSSDVYNDIPDLDYYIDTYPIILEIMEEDGIGNELTAGSYMKFLSSYRKELYPTFIEYMETFSGEYIMEFHVENLLYLVMSMIFGIIISWGYISQTNKKRQKGIEMLMQDIKVSEIPEIQSE